MTGSSFNIYQQLTSVRLVFNGNLSGIYYNGKLNNGIGSTLTAINVGSLSIDSVNVELNDRILLPEQTNSNENGIYIVKSKGSSISLWQLERSNDFQSIEQLKSGQYFSVDSGNTFAGNMYVLIEPLPSSIGGIDSSGASFVNVTTGGGGGSGPFLRIANNLSDVSNNQDSFSNLGFGSGESILLTDSDFVGNQYHLSNPCPNYITIACNTNGNSIYLPSAFFGDDGSFLLSQGPFIIILPGFKNIDVFTSGGSFLVTLDSPANTHFISNGNSSDDGNWSFFSYVESINGISGRAELVAGANINISELGGDITISATSGPSAVTSGQAFYFRPANITPTTFSGPSTPTPILSDGVNVVFQNNFNVSLSGGTPVAQFLTTAPRRILINGVLTVRTSSVLTQTYSVYLLIDSGSSTVLTNAIATITVDPTGAPGPQSIPFVANLEMTGPTDSLQVWISNESATANPVTVSTFEISLLDTTQFGGFTSTDVLPQGVNNLYLSQNGGSTYQNVTGTPVTIGNIAVFDTTGGRLFDAGLQAGQANSINTLQTNTNASFFPIFVASTTNGYQQVRLSTGWSFNPSTNKMNMSALQLSGLSSGSTLIGSDSGKNLESATGFYTLGGLTLNNGGGPLLSTVAPFVLDPVLSDGDYISLGGSGRNIGVTSGGNAFLSYNLDWDGGSSTYKFNGTGNAFTVEVGSGGITFKSATSGSAGTPIVPAVGLSMAAAGAVDIPSITDNTLVARVTGSLTTARGGSFDMAQLMLNSVAAPSLTQSARLNIVGQNSTTDSSLNLYDHVDGFPLINLVAPSHGTEYLNFDCYFDGTDTKSSYSSGSNFRINKSSNNLTIDAAIGVTQGSNITFTTALTVTSAGNLQVNGVSASSIVATDGSGNFTSVPTYSITSHVVVTASTQSMLVNTRYANNYSGGQCVYTLPAATGSGKSIVLVSYPPASTSGWRVNTTGTDKIQFMSSLSAAGGNIISTSGSATDCATFTDDASGLWVVYPAGGLNLVVT